MLGDADQLMFWPTIKPFLSSKENKTSKSVILNENNSLINDQKQVCEMFNDFFAHLSRRLTGELIVYPCSVNVVVVVVVVVHTFQSTSSLKPLGQSNSNFMWSILRKGEQKFV